MPRKPTGNPVGRPPCDGLTPKEKEKFKSTFEGLCAIQCTEEEICSVLNVDVKTLNRWCRDIYEGANFSKIFKIKKEGGKASLRRKQWTLADTNASMAIFLGKQYLGQNEMVETHNTFEDLTPLAELLKPSVCDVGTLETTDETDTDD